MESIYSYTKYKKFISDKILSMPARGRGQKSMMAKFIGCHTAYVSQVLNQSAHFTDEQLFKVSEFFKLNNEEKDFFFLIANENRSGSYELKTYLNRKIEKLKTEMLDLRNRVTFDQELKLEDQIEYYSSWSYTVVDVLLTIPGSSPEKIAERLNLTNETASKITKFLLQTGLLKFDGENYELGVQSIHLPSNSPMISQHHTNLRLKALENLKHKNPEDIFYSSCISISEKDMVAVRDILIETTNKIKAIIKTSTPEDGFIYNIDFFRV